MSSNRGFRVSEDSIMVMIGNKPYTVLKDSIYFEAVKEALRVDLNDAEFVQLLDTATRMRTFTEGDFEIADGCVTYKGAPAAETVTNRILYLMKENLPYSYMKNFWIRLSQNTSKRAQDGLHRFSEHKGMCIMENGMVRAYKAIQRSWLDKHSSTFSNHIGAELSMARHEVCDDPDIGCSYGSTRGPVVA